MERKKKQKHPGGRPKGALKLKQIALYMDEEMLKNLDAAKLEWMKQGHPTGSRNEFINQALAIAIKSFLKKKEESKKISNPKTEIQTPTEDIDLEKALEEAFGE